jgi:hypothetical protein
VSASTCAVNSKRDGTFTSLGFLTKHAIMIEMVFMPSIENAIHDIRSSDAFVVIGAGASFQAGMPLAGQLSPLVWHAVDGSPGLLKRLCAKLGVAVTNGKELLGDDWDRIVRAFECIAGDPTARMLFQDCVSNLNRARSGDVSPVHDALSRLIFARRVAGVLSLNWDTLLECAFRRRYGFWPSSNAFDFWKPHGDCAQPSDEWVLPHQSGLVSDAIIARVTELARARPRVLLVVGYSERDETIVKRLIAPLSRRWRVYRISPIATNEGAIRMDAGAALGILATELAPDPDTPGWQSVSFANQRGIEAAVAGERLGPRDVTSCPRLPHFASALVELDTLNCVDIAGISGSGKSVTVWQLAYHYNQLGWHVIRPDTKSPAKHRQRVDVVSSKRWPTVVVVDDTQFHSGDFLDLVREQSDNRTKIILGTTDANWERKNTIRVSASASVEALGEAFRARRNEILPIVKRFDSEIGDDFLSTRIEARVESASRSETPWQFAYVIRGGWRQTRQILNAARDFEQNHLLLTAITVRQLASLDAGCTREQVVSDAQALGYDESWAYAAVHRLESQGVLLVGETIRCLHLRSAAAIVELALGTKTAGESIKVVDVVRNIVSAPDVALRGISWLLHEIGSYRPGILTHDVKKGILKRCFNAHAHIERRDACFVLANLLGWKDTTASTLVTEFAGQIGTWIIEVDGEDAYGVACLIGNLFHDDKELCRHLLEDTDPRPVAAKLSCLGCEDGYAWGNLLRNLCSACSKEWSDRFLARIDRDPVFEYVGRFRREDLGRLSEFIEGIAWFDFDFALDCLDKAVPVFAASFAHDPFDAYRKMDALQQWVLGHPFFGKPNPSKRQRSITKSIFDGIDPHTIVAQILRCAFGDWEYYARLLEWVGKIHPTKVKNIVAAMDWRALDSVIGEKWRAPPRELRLLLSKLKTNNDGEPIRSWVEEHAGSIEKIEPILAGLSPRAAVAVVGNGNHVDLGGHNRSDWYLQARALARIADENEAAGRAVLRQNRSHLTRALAELSLPNELPKLLELAHILDGQFTSDVIAALSPDEVREEWIKSLSDPRKDRTIRGEAGVAADSCLGTRPNLRTSQRASPKNPISKSELSRTRSACLRLHLFGPIRVAESYGDYGHG